MDDEHTWKQVMDIIRGYEHPLVVVSATARTTRQLIKAAKYAPDQFPKAKKIADEISDRHLLLVNRFISEYGQKYHSQTTEACKRWIMECEKKLVTYLQKIVDRQTLTPKLSDAVAAVGEQFSSYLFTCCAKSYGINTHWLDARSIIKTDSEFGNANPLLGPIKSTAADITKLIDSGQIPVIGGFYGSDTVGHTTTLGFEGSDFTASLLGAALDAKSIEIWTDVSGIYTCDPRVVSEARAIPELSYREATDLAYFGAKVLHPSTMKPASRKNIPLYVKNIFAPKEPGTKIHGHSPTNGFVKAITFLDDAAILSIRAADGQSGPQFLADIFRRFHRYHLAVDVVTTTEAAISVALRKDLLTQPLIASLQEIGTVDQVNNCGIISLIGCRINSASQISNRILQAIPRETIFMLSYSKQKRNLNVVLAEEDLLPAVRAIHKRIVEKQPVH